MTAQRCIIFAFFTHCVFLEVPLSMNTNYVHDKKMQTSGRADDLFIFAHLYGCKIKVNITS